MMGAALPEIMKEKDLVPPGFRRIEEGNAVLVVREVWVEAAHQALAPLHRAWSRIAQRRFTAQGRAGIVSCPRGSAPVLNAAMGRLARWFAGATGSPARRSS
jgi:hypothetical protein